MKKFFRNKAINLINIHAAVVQLAFNLAEIFSAIYLYQLGIPLYQVFLIWTTLFVVRACFRPFALFLVQKIGLKKSVLFGSIFYMGYYLFLGQVDGVNWWLAIFIFYAAWADGFYWLPYHAYYAALGDHGDRGKQLGVREALIKILSMLGPLSGGILINAFGFFAAFVAAAFCMFLAGLLVFFSPEVKIAKKYSFKKAWQENSGFWIFVGDSWLYNAHIYSWNLILFVMLGNVAQLGGLLSLAVFFQISAFLFLGNGIDNGAGRKIYRTGFVLMILAILGRAIFVNTIKEVIFFDLIFALAACFYSPALNTALYNSSKKSKNVLWFQFFAETGWDVGSTIALGTAALITYFGFNPRLILFFSLGSFLILNNVLGRYYKEN